jgi:predicted HTH transcriptional regulator
MAKSKSSTENKADSMEVLEYIKVRGQASTEQVAKKFKIRPTQAAANLAILRIKGAITPQGKGNGQDKSSRWSAV